ncbi:MAG: HAMP domain-containing histidine kinase [Gemmatimonadetes bacterium]|nr:HAMP domain-containing histidine kinase [Gemmatimonadota bacterium]
MVAAPTAADAAGVDAPAVDVSPAALAPLLAAGTALVAETVLGERVDAVPAAATPPASAHVTPAHVAPFDALDLLVEVTHDLRSPLGAVSLLVERLRRGDAGPLTPLQARQLSLIQGAVVSMTALTNDALDLARGNRGLADAPPTAFVVSDLLVAVRALAQPLAEEHGVTLRVSAPPLGRRVGRAALLHRVLLNLVTNACKYTERGSVTVAVETETRDVVRFAVDDTGVGLPAAIVAMLQARSTAPARSLPDSASAVPGAGVGLALCTSLLAAVDSRLEFTTTPTGSRLHFALALPLAA